MKLEVCQTDSRPLKNLLNRIKIFDRFRHLSPTTVSNKSQISVVFAKSLCSFFHSSIKKPKTRFHFVDYHCLWNKHFAVIFLEHFKGKTSFNFHIRRKPHLLTSSSDDSSCKSFRSYLVDDCLGYWNRSWLNNIKMNGNRPYSSPTYTATTEYFKGEYSALPHLLYLFSVHKIVFHPFTDEKTFEIAPTSARLQSNLAQLLFCKKLSRNNLQRSSIRTH